MSLLKQNDADRNAGVTDAEETLRLIAALPAPEGVAERVKHRLHAAPRKSGVISWPTSATGVHWTQLAAMRAAAAAAIVVAVAGGAWGVYTHIQIAPEPAAVAAPQRVDGGGGGLSTAGAVRKPKTLEGPVIAAPANAKQKSDEGHKAMPAKTRAATAGKNQSVQATQR